MRYMAERHNAVETTNDSYSDISFSRTVNSHKFPYGIKVSDNHSGFFPTEFQILGRSADGTKLKNVAAFTNVGKIFDYCMGTDNRVFPDFHIRSNYRIRPNFNAFFQLHVGRNNCRGMNLHLSNLYLRIYLFLPGALRLFLPAPQAVSYTHLRA